MKKKTISIFLAALLLAIVFQTGSMRNYYPAFAQEGSVLSAWASKPPKIDGYIDEEWSAAAIIDFNITSYNGTVYVMNDGGNLYIAAKITDNKLGINYDDFDVFMIFLTTTMMVFQRRETMDFSALALLVHRTTCFTT